MHEIFDAENKDWSEGKKRILSGLVLFTLWSEISTFNNRLTFEPNEIFSICVWSPKWWLSNIELFISEQRNCSFRFQTQKGGWKWIVVNFGWISKNGFGHLLSINYLKILFSCLHFWNSELSLEKKDLSFFNLSKELISLK
jgi:hypothetical protein